MSYQVLARKWRPRRFSELVGQEHVVRALANALDADRTHHAYLFTGTRGVGKTTIARIFAKSLNCERGQSAEPCGECSVCTAVDAGRFVDLLEIDAASNTSVDDVRDMIEKAQYAPARGRYKVYLIDEVHMLSKSAFNALLKTLEEPPPHVKFLLATTDPQKLPVTVLSRCLKFNLKRLLPEQIIGQMQRILAAEQVAFEAPALSDIARGADGSLRDALSLLDQAIAYGGGELKADETRAMLGTIDSGGVLSLLQALATGDGAALLAQARQIAADAPDFAAVLEQLAAALHRIQVRQLVPDQAREDEPGIAALAEAMDAEDVQLYYQIAADGVRQLQLAPDATTGFEMVLLRMLAFRPPAAGEPAPAAPRAKRSGNASATATAARPAERAAPRAPASAGPRASMAVADDAADDDRAQPGAKPAAPAPPATFEAPPPGDATAWGELIDRIALRGPLAELARQSLPSAIDGNRWTLSLRPGHENLAIPVMVEKLREALSTALGRPLALHFATSTEVAATPADHAAAARDARQAEAERAIRNDPLVQRLEAELGAQVVPQSIQPLEN
ncbi:MAG TPA: DNA polymerase III subunit gamma/tau [Rhodanobacteraceae bacterium]|nr:DNA polymerase III subunit gamma/tau [Rhodanobacteraceae bacterium]